MATVTSQNMFSEGDEYMIIQLFIVLDHLENG
jgi:hypothetical protein